MGALLITPMLPFMYIQGKRIKSKIPKLPEARHPEGKTGQHFKKKLKLLALGESTIAGVGVDTHEEGFVGMLARELSEKVDLQVHWKVYAKSGYTAQRVTQKIVPAIRDSKVDLIIVGLGGNDAFHLNSPGQWGAHISQLIDALQAKSPDTPIVFTNMPPIKEFPAFTPLIKFAVGNLVDLLGNELEKITKDRNGVYYYARKIRLKDWQQRLQLDAEDADFFSDGVHPSKFTYQIWARDFTNFLIQDTNLI